MDATLKAVDFLSRSSIVADLSARDKEGVLREIVAHMASSGAIADPSTALAVLMEREKLGSTGIGEGIAIPHGKLPELESVIAAFGRSAEGVEFEAMDGEPVRIFFLLLSPEGSAGLHLKALARVSRLLKSRQFRKELLDAPGGGEIYAKIVEEDSGQ
jgi:nitrogen PTS system EIIA component